METIKNRFNSPLNSCVENVQAVLFGLRIIHLVGGTLRDRGSLLFLLGERREEPQLATALFSDLAAVHGQGRIN